jgi:hypothetical protein
MWDRRVRADTSAAPAVSAAESATAAAPPAEPSTTLAPAEFSLRWVAGVLVCTAAGLVCVGVADALSRAGHSYSGALALFWLGLLLVFLPVAFRVLMRDAGLRERLGLIVLLGASLYVVKVLGSPYGFTFTDEYIHLRNTEDILRTGHLFQLNPLLPTAAYYPGLAAAAAGLVDLTGLSTFVAGLLIIGAARLLISACFFLVALRVTRSSQAAAAASLVYVANPLFLFWSSSFSYEDLALPLAAFVIWWLWRTRREASRLVPVVTVGVIAAVVVTHHVAAFALTALLAAWWLAERLTSRQPEAQQERLPAWRQVVRRVTPRRSVGGQSIGLMALAAGVGFAVWLQFVAKPAESYLLNSNIVPALRQVGAVLLGHASLRHPYSGGGSAAPLWYVLAGFAATLLLLAGLSLAVLRLWRAGLLPWRRRDYWRQPGRAPMIVAIAVAVAFPLTLLPRLTSLGGALSSRSSEYVFAGLGCVLGWLAVRVLGRRSDEPNRPAGQGMFARERRTLAVAAVVTAIFLGEITVGTPYGQLLPESSHPQGYPWMVQPDVVRAAVWTRQHLGVNQRFGVDAIDALALAADGEQDPVQGTSVWPVFFAKRMNAGVVHVIQVLRIRYIFVDLRMTRGRPLTSGNYYFSIYEPRSGVYAGPFPGADLRKFASTACARLIYQSGPIEILDVSSIEDGSCVPTVTASP